MRDRRWPRNPSRQWEGLLALIKHYACQNKLAIDINQVDSQIETFRASRARQICAIVAHSIPILHHIERRQARNQLNSSSNETTVRATSPIR